MALKRFKDINEGYDMDIDRGDMVEEHAKDVIGRYLDGSLGGMTVQGAFNAMFDENMRGMSDDTSPQQKQIIEAIQKIADELKANIKVNPDR